MQSGAEQQKLRGFLLAVSAALAVLVTSACADARPTGPSAHGAEAARYGDCIPGEKGIYTCPPIDSNTPGTGTCDPMWWTPECGPADGGECMTSGEDDEDEFTGLAGCPGPAPGPGGGTPPPTGGYEPPVQSADTCNTGDAVLDDPVVQSGFSDLWQQSRFDLEQSQRLESAAWIVQNQDGSRQLVPIMYTQRDACGVNGNWYAPPGTVGFVHTHPFTSGEVMTACGPITWEGPDGRLHVVIGQDGHPLYHRYNNEPSPRDRDLLQNVINHVRKARNEAPLEGYVIDNERITRYLNANDAKDRAYNRCGY